VGGEAVAAAVLVGYRDCDLLGERTGEPALAERVVEGELGAGERCRSRDDARELWDAAPGRLDRGEGFLFLWCGGRLGDRSEAGHVEPPG
jgi:hypothetical protein